MHARALPVVLSRRYAQILHVTSRGALAPATRSFSTSLRCLDGVRAAGVSGGSAPTAAYPAFSGEHSGVEEEEEPLYEDPRTAILEAALKHVAREGWTQEALAAGAHDLGYPSITQGLFKNGAADLVHYFMQRCNVLMVSHMESLDLSSLPVNDRIYQAVKARLEAQLPVLRTWPQAMAVGASPSNVTATLELLGTTVDDIWYLAGDRSADLTWYTRRGLLLGVYVATEAYMLTDASPDRADTWAFLRRRINEVAAVGEQAGYGLSSATTALHSVGSVALGSLEAARPMLQAGVPVAAQALSSVLDAVGSVAGSALKATPLGGLVGAFSSLTAPLSRQRTGPAAGAQEPPPFFSVATGPPVHYTPKTTVTASPTTPVLQQEPKYTPSQVADSAGLR